MTKRIVTTVAGWLALATLTTACSLSGGGGESATERSGGDDAARPDKVVLATHDSFALPKGLVADFERQSGYDLVVRPSGDAGELTNKLVLTAGDPIADAAFGIDNAFAGRALGEEVFLPHDATLPAGADRFLLDADAEGVLAPVDTGNVCVNVDTAWFAQQELTPPATLADLTEPAYADLFVTPGATTSSPGFAFLLATIAAYGDDWQGYWEDLMANGTKITKGWEDAYFVDFTAGGGENATRPIVVSYDSSPAFTIDEKSGRSTTRALLRTCTRQVEYAGVLAGADNEDGARELVEFLLSQPVQTALPTSMYVFPVRDDVRLPRDWARFAKRPQETLDVDPQDIEEHRDTWLREWTDVTSR